MPPMSLFERYEPYAPYSEYEYYAPPNGYEYAPGPYSPPGLSDSSSPTHAHMPLAPPSPRTQPKRSRQASTGSEDADADAHARELKRQRNTDASRRFRINKKAKEESLAAHAKKLETQVAALQADKAALKMQVRVLMLALRGGEDAVQDVPGEWDSRDSKSTRSSFSSEVSS